MKRINIINSHVVSSDISSLVDHISPMLTREEKWFSKIYFREVIKSQHYDIQSQDESHTYVNYVGSQELLDKARYIVDWLAGLQERDSQIHGKLERITFQQALKHSENWHRELAKKAEQSDRYIEPDAVNAPKVLDLGEGWEVFWLKTDEARDMEGEVMGHCVGSGAYDDLCAGEEVFSIRKNNVPHITLHLNNLDIKQAVTKGNGDVPDRYQYLVDRTADIIGAKIFSNIYPLEQSSLIPNGWHKNKNRDRFHIRDGVLHHDNDNPAVIYANGRQEWRINGKLHRLNGPAVIKKSGVQIWYKNGKTHREGGPAAIYGNGSQEWYQNDLLHREDGPAIIKTNGYKAWYVDGERHREDGPAVITSTGTKYWYKNGALCEELRNPGIKV